MKKNQLFKMFALLTSFILTSCTVIESNSNSTIVSSNSSNKETSSIDNSNNSVPISSTSFEQVSSSSNKESSESSTSSSSGAKTDVLEVKAVGLNNHINLTFSYKDNKYSSCNIYFSKDGINFVKVTEKDGYVDNNRATILGLLKGTYSLKIVPLLDNSEVNDLAVLVTNIEVSDYDNSGYANFKNSNGIGAYNSDGTLKDNADVIYVNDTNKNTIKYNNKTGLVNILQSKLSKPLAVRIVGSINTNQFKAKKFTPFSKNENPEENVEAFTNTLETTYQENLNGLTCKVFGNSKAKEVLEKANANSGYIFQSAKASYDDTDSAFNNLTISNAKDLTIEGLFDDAIINQWGMTFKASSSILVRNLTFSNYPEDACAFEGNSSDPTKYKNMMVTHCVFNVGKNNWDLTYEQDKKEGDGSNDIKGISNYTSSYNIFNNCHKTGLIGGSDSTLTMNVTMHHNYYNSCSSRMPLGRQANIHMYNNYYYKASKGQDIRANAFVLSEYNVFDNCQDAQLVKDGVVIKSYKDTYKNGKNNHSNVSTVSSREQKVTSNNCKPDGKTNYANFDTNKDLFYYDEINKVSDVSNLITDTTDLLNYLKINAGIDLK